MKLIPEIILISWIIFMAFPGWGAINNSWGKRKEFPNIFMASIGLFVFNVLLVCYLIWFVVFSEPWDTNGLVMLVAFLLLPAFALVVTLPTYIILGKMAVKKGAWVKY